MQGYVASVWAMAALIGPTLGGVFSETIGWRWIFFVNLPLGPAGRRGCCGAGSRSRSSAREHRDRRRRRRACSALGGTLLLLALLEGGVEWGWGSPASLGALRRLGRGARSRSSLVEQRAAEPVLPMWVFRMRVLNVANAGSLVVGVLTLGLSSYVPLYAQQVLGSGAVVAGLALAAMTIGWPIAAATGGPVLPHARLPGDLCWAARSRSSASLLLLTVDGDSSVLHLAAACFVMGIGFGYVASPAVVAAQTAVAWSRRGVATGANMFARSVGSAVGVAVFGAVVNSDVSEPLGAARPDIEHVSSRDPRARDPRRLRGDVVHRRGAARGRRS